MRIILLIVGVLLMLFQQFVFSVTPDIQFFLFIAGILFLGVPHGAADLLVANKIAVTSKRQFSATRFLINYIARLLIFALILWIIPLVGILIFIVFAAYHFGETDLYNFRTDLLTGKVFVVSYGLFILSLILVHHFDEVRPLIESISRNTISESYLRWINDYRYSIVSAAGILFFLSSFLYFFLNKQALHPLNGNFLVQLAALIIVLFNLPLMIGFTFYFIVWHSVLSLKNIILYLRKDNGFSVAVIRRQLLTYSFLSIAGIGIFGILSYSYFNQNTVASIIFLGLAVLTAPHMQVMYDMYHRFRANNR